MTSGFHIGGLGRERTSAPLTRRVGRPDGGARAGHRMEHERYVGRSSASASIAAPRPATIRSSSHAAEALGAALAREGLELVFGGGSCGLMGVVATRGARPWRQGHRNHSRLSRRARDRALRRHRSAGRAGHAYAQAADVREVRRFRGASGRHRHARGADRAIDLDFSSAATASRWSSPISAASGSRCCRCSRICTTPASSAPAMRCATWSPSA